MFIVIFYFNLKQSDYSILFAYLNVIEFTNFNFLRRHDHDLSKAS